MFSCPDASLCGEVSLADIGIPDSVLAEIAPKTFVNEPALWLAHYPWPQAREPQICAGSRGGGIGSRSIAPAPHGSPRAVRSEPAPDWSPSPRPGMRLQVNAAQLTAIMVREADDARALKAMLADPRKNAVLIGPGVGVGERTKEMVLAALALERRGRARRRRAHLVRRRSALAVRRHRRAAGAGGAHAA